MKAFASVILATLIFGPGNQVYGEQIFGKGANPSEKIAISNLLSQPQTYMNKIVTVDGMVVAVCAKRGCWMTLASDKKYETLRIKVRDGVMVFPLSARGKMATVKGQFKVIKLSKEEAISFYRHWAKEQGQEFDPGTVKGTKTIYQIDAKGAVIH